MATLLALLRHRPVRPAIRRRRALSFPHREFRPRLRSLSSISTIRRRSGVRIARIPGQWRVYAGAVIFQSGARRRHRRGAMHAGARPAPRHLRRSVDRFVLGHGNAGAGRLPAAVPRRAAALGSADPRLLRAHRSSLRCTMYLHLDRAVFEGRRVQLDALERLCPLRRRVLPLRPVSVARSVAHLVRLWGRSLFELRAACPLSGGGDGAVQDRVRIRSVRRRGLFRISVRLPVRLYRAATADSRSGDHLSAERHISSFAHGMALGLYCGARWRDARRGARRPAGRAPLPPRTFPAES